MSDKREQDQEFEQALLGSLLLENPDSLPRLSIQSHCFSNKNNGLIFRTYQEQIKNGIKPNILTLCNDPGLANVDPSYIASLTSKTPSAANIQYYESKIINAWQTRTAKQASEKFNAKIEAADFAGDIKPVIREYIGILSGALCDSNIEENKIFPTLSEIKARWDAYDPDKDFIPPLLGGTAIKDGTLTYIGARTGIGKTTALISIAREAMNAERKVIFFTLEELTDEILRKLILCDIYANAGKSRDILQKLASKKGDLIAAFHAARKGKYVKGDTDATLDFKKKVLDGQEKFDNLYGSRLIFIEGHKLKTSEKQAAAITKHAMPGDIILVDYIQRIADPDGESLSSYMKGKAQSETLFSIAKDTGAAVISGAQFKRAVNELPRELAPLGFKPFDESSFRETGDIEQDGDYLFGIGDHMSDADQRFLKILKVRSGSGRNRCYSIDFQGAFNYMGIGNRLTIMNPAHEPKRKTKESDMGDSSGTIRSSNPLK